MTTFWMFMPWIPHWLNAGYLLGRCEFLNGMELVRARPVDGEFSRNELPTLQIELTAEDFHPDCFDWNGFTLVSEKMRHAMALGPSDIQYFDIDSSRASPLPRSKRYQIMHVPVSEDVSDPERSEYSLRHRPKALSCLGIPALSLSVRTPSQPMKFSTIGFSRLFFAPTGLRCAFCGPDVRECDFWILSICAVGSGFVPFAASRRSNGTRSE